MPKKLSKDSLDELIGCFQFVADPRVQGRSKHLLIDIVILSILAIICGAEGISEIEEFGIQKERWLKRYLKLPHGIPSHDTIARVLSLINPSKMEIAFSEWVKSIARKGPTKTISLDGKSVVGTERNFADRFEQLHLVSAYSHELGLSLFQTESAGRGLAEVTSALQCLEVLDLKGVTVMGDAALSTKGIVSKIREKDGHYVLPIKGNRRPYLEELEEYFQKNKKRLKKAKSKERGHGREELRICELLPVAQLSDRFRDFWVDCEIVFSITRKRIEPDKRPMIHRIDEQGVRHFEKNENQFREKEETTFYVSSRKLNPKEALAEARKHWGIENNLHWVLDVAFGEDTWMVRAKGVARCLSLLRKVAYNIIRKSNTKGSIKARMKRAGWNNNFLQELLFE
jgi:predicted transposase YbfD/YdcC